MTAAIAPIADNVLDENGQKFRPSWIVYFSELNRGDVGTTWTPVITNLTAVGTPTITGVYYQNGGLTDFAVKIVPGTNTSSTLGSTTIALPFNVTADTGAFVITGTTVLQGVVNASGRSVFLPTWSLVTAPVTITGRVKN
jgi:hypothetical protein